jgi:DNA-binding transcriptional LysR family regulator
MLQWDDVRVLLALLRAKNLAGGGARLGVDRTTMSRRLAALEKTLGVRLFARTREGLRPTAAAERLRGHAESMEIEATALANAAQAGEERAAGVVRIATTEAMGVFLVMQGLLAVREHHPDVLVEILGSNRPVDLSRGEADVALRVSKVADASLRVRCVARLPIGLFASPAYLRARGLPRGVAALRGHDVLLPAGELENLPESRWLAARPGVRVVFRSSSMPAIAAAAVAGEGLAALTLPWGDGEPGLERVMVIDDLPKRPIWLVTPAGASGRPAVRVVCDRIAAIYARAS